VWGRLKNQQEIYLFGLKVWSNLLHKHMEKLVKYYEQAEECETRKKAQKLIKKADKVRKKHEELLE